MSKSPARLRAIPKREFTLTNCATYAFKRHVFYAKPVAKKGQFVDVGTVLGRRGNRRPETRRGQNVLVAFMLWNGYNFEDAILLSD
ncbi:MAG: hypothetical protein ACLUKN_07850 [Bacilli bacterium]